MKVGATILVFVLGALGCGRDVVVSGLRQTTPPLHFDSWSGSSCWRTDSLQPTLRWEAFPRPLDLDPGNPNPLRDATNVTYELTIWEAGRLSEPVYAQTGLSEPCHTVGILLKPRQEYCWTVRARFETHGQVRFTQWATWDTVPSNDKRSGQLLDGRSPFVLRYCFRTP